MILCVIVNEEAIEKVRSIGIGAIQELMNQINGKIQDLDEFSWPCCDKVRFEPWLEAEDLREQCRNDDTEGSEVANSDEENEKAHEAILSKPKNQEEEIIGKNMDDEANDDMDYSEGEESASDYSDRSNDSSEESAYSLTNEVLSGSQTPITRSSYCVKNNQVNNGRWVLFAVII